MKFCDRRRGLKINGFLYRRKQNISEFRISASLLFLSLSCRRIVLRYITDRRSRVLSITTAVAAGGDDLRGVSEQGIIWNPLDSGENSLIWIWESRSSDLRYADSCLQQPYTSRRKRPLQDILGEEAASSAMVDSFFCFSCDRSLVWLGRNSRSRAKEMNGSLIV
ncbi:unnamed protein product [Citrullus colocynthis]|uniref:Uncharacterized protein n=1 Tax=Citrullus colocynthis TaxID=252529 RepID=A0ABP0YQT9_9ROSI